MSAGPSGSTLVGTSTVPRASPREFDRLAVGISVSWAHPTSGIWEIPNTGMFRWNWALTIRFSRPSPVMSPVATDTVSNVMSWFASTAPSNRKASSRPGVSRRTRPGPLARSSYTNWFANSSSSPSPSMSKAPTNRCSNRQAANAGALPEVLPGVEDAAREHLEVVGRIIEHGEQPLDPAVGAAPVAGEAAQHDLVESVPIHVSEVNVGHAGHAGGAVADLHGALREHGEVRVAVVEEHEAGPVARARAAHDDPDLRRVVIVDVATGHLHAEPDVAGGGHVERDRARHGPSAFVFGKDPDLRDPVGGHAQEDLRRSVSIDVSGRDAQVLDPVAVADRVVHLVEGLLRVLEHPQPHDARGGRRVHVGHDRLVQPVPVYVPGRGVHKAEPIDPLRVVERHVVHHGGGAVDRVEGAADLHAGLLHDAQHGPVERGQRTVHHHQLVGPVGRAVVAELLGLTVRRGPAKRRVVFRQRVAFGIDARGRLEVDAEVGQRVGQVLGGTVGHRRVRRARGQQEDGEGQGTS